MMKSKYYFSFLLLSLLGLVACSVITPIPTPAVEVYTLSPSVDKSDNELSTTGHDETALILALSPINSSQDFMGTGIIYRDHDYSYNSYAYSRWNDSPSKLLAIYFQYYLSESQRFSAVVPNSSTSHADVLLEATLLDFSHHLALDKDNSTGRVSIIFYLIDSKSKRLLASKQFNSEITVETESAKGATKALNLASESVAADLREWLEGEVERIDNKK